MTGRISSTTSAPVLTPKPSKESVTDEPTSTIRHTSTVKDTKLIESQKKEPLSTDDFVKSKFGIEYDFVRVRSLSEVSKESSNVVLTAQEPSLLEKIKQGLKSALSRIKQGLKSALSRIEQFAAETFGYRKIDLTAEDLANFKFDKSDKAVKLLNRNLLSSESGHEVLKKIVALDGDLDAALYYKVQDTKIVREYVRNTRILISEIKQERQMNRSIKTPPFIDNFRREVMEISYFFSPNLRTTIDAAMEFGTYNR